MFLPFYRRKWKRSTAITCESRIRTHVLAEFGSRPLGSFDRVELQDWLESKAGEGLSHSTIDHLRWDLSQIFKMAAAEGCISRSPATLLFTPRAARTPPQRRMNLQEVNLCFEVLDQRERLIAMLALTAGMRPGEILALQWKHIRPDHIEVVQRVYHQEIDTPKTKHSVRSVALSPALKASLESWRAVALSGDPEAWVFPSETGRTPVIAENIWRRNFLPRLKTVGLEWATFLVMRRTHASLMRDLDVDPKLVAAQLGHTLDVSLNVYAKSGLARRGEALAVLCFALQAAHAYGQSVTLLNLTRPWVIGGDFYVGESWQLNVSGAPFQQVAISSVHNGGPLSGPLVLGTTDGSGNYSLTGSMSTFEIGSWTE